jgi:hypothetical protein
LKENIPDMEMSSLFVHLLLSARVVLSFHASVISTLKQFSPAQNDESEAVRTIVLYANYVDHEVMNETVEEKIGYAIQVYWGKFPVFHRIVETDLITF